MLAALLTHFPHFRNDVTFEKYDLWLPGNRSKSSTEDNLQTPRIPLPSICLWAYPNHQSRCPKQAFRAPKITHSGVQNWPPELDQNWPPVWVRIWPPYLLLNREAKSGPHFGPKSGPHSGSKSGLHCGSKFGPELGKSFPQHLPICHQPWTQCCTKLGTKSALALG